MVTVPIYNLINYAQGFDFCHIVTNTCRFDDSYSNKFEMTSHHALDLYFPQD